MDARTRSPLPCARKFARTFLRLVHLLCAGLCLTLPAALGAVDITFFNSAFVPTTVTIEAGDTVNFVWAAGVHTVTSGVSSDPADDPGALFDVSLDAAHPLFSYTFTATGTYSFFDRLHETGLVGTVIVQPHEVVVEIVDNAFTPEHVYVFAGDSVRWQWIEGTHTVTSGASSSPADNPGALFNAVSTQAQPVFIHVFAVPGVYPYFCLPHEAMGMGGSVTVQRLFVRGDVNRDQAVNIADPIALLAHLFGGEPAPACPDAADANDDGVLDISDAVRILARLFGGSAPLPPPYPSPGPDRTADVLLCP